MMAYAVINKSEKEETYTGQKCHEVEGLLFLLIFTTNSTINATIRTAAVIIANLRDVMSAINPIKTEMKK